jgi:hypothetical protein
VRVCLPARTRTRPPPLHTQTPVHRAQQNLPKTGLTTHAGFNQRTHAAQVAVHRTAFAPRRPTRANAPPAPPPHAPPFQVLPRVIEWPSEHYPESAGRFSNLHISPDKCRLARRMHAHGLVLRSCPKAPSGLRSITPSRSRPSWLYEAPNYILLYYTTTLLHGYTATPTRRSAGSWLKVAPSHCGDTSPQPTPVILEAWRAPAQSGGQPWQVGGLARRQRARPRPRSKQRFSRFQPDVVLYSASLPAALLAGCFRARAAREEPTARVGRRAAAATHRVHRLSSL